MRVAVTAVVPVIFTGLVELKLNVGGSWNWATFGPEQVVERITLPVKPPPGVTVMVDVFPEVAPGATVTGVPLTEKPGVVRF